MSLLADALQPRLIRELFILQGRPAICHIADVVTNAPRSGYDLDADYETKQLKIDFRETSFIISAIGGDASRLASACFASMAGITEALESPQYLSWALIRLYYAAFYGGHSLLRLLGHGCTYFDKSHTDFLKVLLTARGNPVGFDLPSGLYACAMNSGRTGFKMAQARGRVGGAHEIFWTMFDQIFSELSETVLCGHLRDRDARDVYVKIDAVRRIYSRGAGASWLSTVRNNVQYRQGMGVWMPLTINRQTRSVLPRLASQWTRDPMDIDIDAPRYDDLSAFVIGCVFTTAMCRTMFTRLSERSTPPAKSFARQALQICS